MDVMGYRRHLGAARRSPLPVGLSALLLFQYLLVTGTPFAHAQIPLVGKGSDFTMLIMSDPQLNWW